MTKLLQIVFYLLNTSNDALSKINPTSHTLSKRCYEQSLALKTLQFVMFDEGHPISDGFILYSSD